jgi:PEGA domain
MRYGIRTACILFLACVSVLLTFSVAADAQNDVLGQIEIIPATKEVRTSGVWVDGQYVGYVNELRGHNRIHLLPGDHELVIRQAGYSDFSRKVLIEPGLILDVRVNPERDTRFVYPKSKSSSIVRLQVQPDRAAVFVDDNFVGHVDEFYGVERGMIIAPGKHQIKIAFPGFKTFEAEVELLPKQQFTLKTDLMKGSIADADPLIRAEAAPRPNNAAAVSDLADSSPAK